MSLRHLILLAWALPLCMDAQRTRELEQLATTMAGSYTSAEQAMADTSYFDIELEMVRVWPKRKDGAWLYVEQATAAKKDRPYRQRFYHLQQVNDSTFTSTILSIKGGQTFYGAYKDPVWLGALPMDSLEVLPGCDITLVRHGDIYVGSTDGKKCTNAWGKASYATSEVIVGKDRMVSWDRGWNDAGEQVWGAEKGGYIFLKRP